MYTPFNISLNACSHKSAVIQYNTDMRYAVLLFCTNYWFKCFFHSIKTQPFGFQYPIILHVNVTFIR